MGIMNVVKGAGKNIMAAARTDGVMKAALKRTAAGAGIGAGIGGTVSAIQGGSFGEGAVRGGIMGGMAGAASSAYKMGALGAQSLDSGGRFRKGATSVYSHVLEGNATWEQVNKYRAQDADSFMSHIRKANDAQDLADRFVSMDKGESYQKSSFAAKDKAAKQAHIDNANEAHNQADMHKESDAASKEAHNATNAGAQNSAGNAGPDVGSQVNTNPSSPVPESPVTPTATTPEVGTVNSEEASAYLAEKNRKKQAGREKARQIAKERDIKNSYIDPKTGLEKPGAAYQRIFNDAKIKFQNDDIGFAHTAALIDNEAFDRAKLDKGVIEKYKQFNKKSPFMQRREINKDYKSALKEYQAFLEGA